jgi:hypothetical protein
MGKIDNPKKKKKENTSEKKKKKMRHILLLRKRGGSLTSVGSSLLPPKTRTSLPFFLLPRNLPTTLTISPPSSSFLRGFSTTPSSATTTTSPSSSSSRSIPTGAPPPAGGGSSRGSSIPISKKVKEIASAARGSKLSQPGIPFYRFSDAVKKGSPDQVTYRPSLSDHQREQVQQQQQLLQQQIPPKLLAGNNLDGEGGSPSGFLANPSEVEIPFNVATENVGTIEELENRIVARVRRFLSYSEERLNGVEPTKLTPVEREIYEAFKARVQDSKDQIITLCTQLDNTMREEHINEENELYDSINSDLRDQLYRLYQLVRELPIDRDSEVTPEEYFKQFGELPSFERLLFQQARFPEVLEGQDQDSVLQLKELPSDPKTTYKKSVEEAEIEAARPLGKSCPLCREGIKKIDPMVQSSSFFFPFFSLQASLPLTLLLSLSLSHYPSIGCDAK